MALTTDDAICIKVWDWSETSQTVSLFSRTHGVLRCVAKGSKRENSKFSGGLELMTRGEMMASIKTGGAMTLLTSWDLLEVFPAARARLSAFYAGMTMLDTVQHAVTDHDPHPSLYDALARGLRWLDDANLEGAAVLGVLWSALSETGHRPELGIDVATGEPHRAAETYAFSPRLGGLTSDGPRASDAGVAWRVRAETVGLLRGLGGQGRIEGSAEAVVRATRLMAMYYREVFGTEPATFRRLLGEEFRGGS